MSGAYYIQVWLKCEHEECGAMVDLMLSLDDTVYHRSMEVPPGWSHRRSSGEYGGEAGACYSATALCPQHGDPCIHTLEQQQPREGTPT